MKAVAALLLAAVAGHAYAFQIGTLGPPLESRLTNESESSLLRAGGRLGKLLKSPVHEEITQIAFDCPADLSKLGDDDACGQRGADFASSFIMYGVRWNDLPPFRLDAGQGAKCRKLGILSAPACNTEQTVRFSTQPDCWLCLFFDAEKIAQTSRISGCQKGANVVQGNLMTRSHFGDLQFLHAMADAEYVAPEVTQGKLLDWAQFAWKVFDREFGGDTQLKTIAIPTIQYHFGCTEWTVSDLYVLGAKPTLNRRLTDIAFGSIAHTVQDSFAAGHAERAPAVLGAVCAPDLPVARPGAIVEFHAYGQQDGHKHDAQDARTSLIDSATSSAGVIAVMRQLYSYWDQNAEWKEVEPFFRCIFALDISSRPSSAGAEFVR